MRLFVHTGEVFKAHKVGRFHPEVPERLDYIMSSSPHVGFTVEEPKKGDIDLLLLVHDPWHVETVRTTVLKGLTRLDIDTDVSRESFDVALWAAGTAADAALRSRPGEIRLALVRPPGHHASRTESRGFCIFNNIAIAVEALKEREVSKIAIFDFDAHHGDGTQSVFHDRRDVLYVSVHQDPATLYPGTGFPDEVGTGEGEGYTINMPLPPGSGDMGLLALTRVAKRIIEMFSPDALGFSMGFDGHHRDPLTELNYSIMGFHRIGNIFSDLCSGIPCFGTLEGGYDPFGLGKGFWNFAFGLVGRDPPYTEGGTRGPEKLEAYLNWIKSSVGKYWPLGAR